LEFYSIFEEGAAIAREIQTAVSEQKSILLISPNQKLTEIVKSELQRWNIFADDSQGTLFSKTAPGILISLVIDMAENSYDCVSVIKVLKMNSKFRATIMKTELFFRKLQSVPSNFFAAFDLYPKDEIDAEFLATIERFREIFEKSDHKFFAKPFSEWSDLCCRLASEINPESVEQLHALLPCSDWSVKITLQEFGIFIKNHVLSKSVRTAEGYTPGVVILGAIEAQLLDADRIIIGAVNDESWHKTTAKNDFWITQSLMKYFGMQTAEMQNEFLQSIFSRFVHKKNVLLTRSIMADGKQQQRYRHLDKLSENFEFAEAIELKKTMKELLTGPGEPIRFEIPCPNINLRPQQFTVSDIDLLQENPYAFYAKRILQLPELYHINELRNIRGNYLHNVLEKFVNSNNFTADSFLHTAKNVLKNKWINSIDFGLWFFRLRKISNFIAHNMTATKYWTELGGKSSIRITENYSITVRCRADRIDADENGNITVADYKTGAVPSIASVRSGEKIQLPLESLIAENGGFGPEKTKIKAICYWKTDGKDDDGGKIITVAETPEEIRQINAVALEKLKNLMQKYNIRGEGYDVNTESRYEKPYMHLERTKEWHDAR
jgi:ATP-dependent helicase/nuclease subunit B